MCRNKASVKGAHYSAVEDTYYIVVRPQAALTNSFIINENGIKTWQKFTLFCFYHTQWDWRLSTQVTGDCGRVMRYLVNRMKYMWWRIMLCRHSYRIRTSSGVTITTGKALWQYRLILDIITGIQTIVNILTCSQITIVALSMAYFKTIMWEKRKERNTLLWWL